jgi:hypothetical protein
MTAPAGDGAGMCAEAGARDDVGANRHGCKGAWST